jgi:hypothetical protein
MSASPAQWLAIHAEDGESRFRVGRTADGFVAEWCGLARLTVSRDGGRSELAFEDEVPEAHRRKLERGAATLLLRQLHGKLGVHGAAVAFAGRAVVLVGGSGDGKSTLAAAACEAGATLLADDAVAIDLQERGAVVTPTDSIHWLDDGARAALGMVAVPVRGEKAAVPPKKVGEGAVSLAAIVMLSWGEEHVARASASSECVPVVVGISGTGALARILPHVVRLVVDDPVLNRAELDGLHALVEHVPVHVLERVRAFDQLPATVDLIRRLCLSPREISDE